MDSFMQIRYPDGPQLVAILVSTVANIGLGMLWYGKFFGKSWVRLICQDKGIASSKGKKDISMEEFEEATQTRWPYPTSYSYASSMLCNITKSWFFFHWFSVLGVSLPADALKLGVCWSTIHLVSIHQYFWQGKRMQLAFIDYGYELCGVLLTVAIISQLPLLIGSSV